MRSKTVVVGKQKPFYRAIFTCPRRRLPAALSSGPPENRNEDELRDCTIAISATFQVLPETVNAAQRSVWPEASQQNITAGEKVGK
jgi:hypothetical protein